MTYWDFVKRALMMSPVISIPLMVMTNTFNNKNSHGGGVALYLCQTLQSRILK